jgi:hypothetical protein
MSGEHENKIGVYVIPCLLFGGLAAYMLVTGELPIDKQRTMTITRAANPMIYWPILLVSCALAALCLRRIWKGVTGS